MRIIDTAATRSDQLQVRVYPEIRPRFASAALDLRGLPGEAAGLESEAGDALPTADSQVVLQSSYAADLRPIREAAKHDAGLAIKPGFHPSCPTIAGCMSITHSAMRSPTSTA